MEEKEKPRRPLTPIRSIRQRLPLILIISALIATLGILGVFKSIKPRYRAEALMNVLSTAPKILYKTEDTLRARSYEDWMRTQINIIKSYPILEGVIEKYQAEGFRWQRPGESIRSAMDRLAAKLKVVQRRDTQLISIAIGSSNPRGLSEIVNLTVQGYIDFNKNKQAEEVNFKVDLLKKEREEVLAEMDSHHTALEGASKFGASTTEEREMEAALSHLNQLKTMQQQANHEVSMLQRDLSGALSEVERKNLQQNLQVARESARNLASELDRQTGAMKGYSREVIKAKNKRKEVARLQEHLVSINERIEQIILEAESPGRVEIVNWAHPPEGPADDARTKIAGILGFLSLVIGAVIAILIDLLRGRIDRPEDLEKYLGFPLTGFILNSKADHVDSTEMGLLFKYYPQSFLYEQCLHIALYFEKEHQRHSSKLFCFHGVQDGNGVSSVALNILASIDAPKKKRLFIDANYRAPMVKKLPELQEAKGFSELILASEEEGFDFEKEWHHYVNFLDEVPFGVMPLGHASAALPYGLHLNKIKNLFQVLKQEFEYIFLDAPPFLSFKDSQSLTLQADVVALVPRAQMTRWSDFEKVMNELQHLGVQAISVILNGVPLLKGDELKAEIEIFYQRVSS